MVQQPWTTTNICTTLPQWIRYSQSTIPVQPTEVHAISACCHKTKFENLHEIVQHGLLSGFATDNPVKNCPMLQCAPFLPFDTRYTRLTGGRMSHEYNVLIMLDHQRLSRENRLRVNAQGTLCVPIYDKSQALGPDYWITILIRNLKSREWDPLWDKRMATEPPTGIYRKDELSPPTFHPDTFANLHKAANTVRTDENNRIHTLSN